MAVSNFCAMLEMMVVDSNPNQPLQDGYCLPLGSEYMIVPSTRDLSPTGCSDIIDMLRNPPAVAFEKVRRTNEEEFNHDDEGKEYAVFRESNARRDEWRNAVLAGPRKNKTIPSKVRIHLVLYTSKATLVRDFQEVNGMWMRRDC